jgi:hypothetical protein
MLKRFKVDSFGRKYLLGELRKGNSYAQALLETTRIQGGQIYTYLPSILQSAKAKFQDGILTLYDSVGMSGEDLYHQLQSACSTMLYQYLSNNENGYVIFERIGRPKSPIIQKERNPYFVFRDEVYLFHSHNSASLSTVEECMRKSRRYPLIMGLTSLTDPSIEVSPRETIDLRTLTMFAERTEMLVVGAYDDEGYILWSKLSANIESFAIKPK